MTSEQTLNAMVPCALRRLKDAGSLEYIGATAMVSASDLRVLLAHVDALKADAKRYRRALERIAAIQDDEFGDDWGPLESAREIARSAMNGA